MARTIRGEEFSNRNAGSRYPLIPSATAQDSSELFNIPNDFLAGLLLTVPADLRISSGSYRISRIIYTHGICTLFIAGMLDDALVELGRFDVSRTNLETQILRYGYGFTSFAGTSQYADIRGRLMIGSAEGLNSQPQGEFLFSYGATGISVDCIRPVMRHLSAIEVLTTAGGLYRLPGVVRIRGGENIGIRIETVDQRPVIVLDAVDASQLNEQLQCELASDLAIRRINGLPGNTERQVELIGSNCLSVTPQGNGIQLDNSCSEPCASCTEAESLQALIEPFVEQVPTLTSLVNRLQAAIEQMQLTVQMTRGNPTCGGT